MTKAIRIHEHGGPEVLKWEDVEAGDPGEGEVRIRHTAVGLNFIDCYQRSGLYPMDLPLTLGSEAAGVIEAVGPGVEGLSAGQRVAYAGGQLGSYAEARVMNAGVLAPVPDGIEDQTAAAMMLKGMTAQMLLFKCYPVKAGDTILVHAAAGGVGSIMCQWGKHLGATVIGTVGSDAKAEIAKAHGCDHPINYATENFAERVREITGSAGVPVVYDSVGKETFENSLDCLSKFGYLISFGNASGPAPAVEPLTLMAKGSVFLNRPTLMHYIADHGLRLEAARALFEVVESGAVKIEVGQTFPLADAAKAHAALESRATTGSTVLLP
ncbi:MAG: quinone oxidoreductase [Rhodospirillales bacterium]|jgi:NADPH2:quinone reductase|nr:quinone oxidoreductase [Rhodospirillaceae bacterium]MDP6428325.1 quinone oxidoreductase [Rhodospirillales bacterium]MDP6642570.1 quinone oxidoreductase [Rhodospirillales bacterium]MDP6841883.1 quinone oxidoreductase [Rhodospirillales bacterium]